MPGFDGTGPRGEGPMTGGRRGFCNPNYAPYGQLYGVGRGGMPWGGGRGRAFGGGIGFGRRMGRGWWFGAGRGFNAQQISVEDERAYLIDQLKVLEDEINEINERVKELDREKK